jgi:hypothetical protein
MLGYKYLWIDAFCIIQSDETDKARELVKMDDIYRYALFTIYAKGLSSSKSGKLTVISTGHHVQEIVTDIVCGLVFYLSVCGGIYALFGSEYNEICAY